MSAEILREAAQLMRERAEKAEPGRWKLWGMAVMADPRGTSNVDDCIEVAAAYTPSWCERQPRTFNATHIASWHPVVALAVANVLEVAAVDFDNGYAEGDDFACDAILAAARAYLGEPS